VGSHGNADRWCRQVSVDLEYGLLGRRGEAALDAPLQARHQDRVTEAFPALLRVVDGDDDPAVRGRAGEVVELASRQCAVTRVHGRD
jgi:hypothetical protein